MLVRRGERGRAPFVQSRYGRSNGCSAANMSTGASSATNLHAARNNHALRVVSDGRHGLAYETAEALLSADSPDRHRQAHGLALLVQREGRIQLNTQPRAAMCRCV